MQRKARKLCFYFPGFIFFPQPPKCVVSPRGSMPRSLCSSSDHSPRQHVCRQFFSLSAQGFLNCDSQATASEICRWLITSLSSCSVKGGIARRGLVLQLPSLPACPSPTKLGTWAPTELAGTWLSSSLCPHPACPAGEGTSGHGRSPLGAETSMINVGRCVSVPQLGGQAAVALCAVLLCCGGRGGVQGARV